MAEEKKRKGSVMIANVIGTPTNMAVPYRAQCMKCASELQMTQASYEAWQKAEGPHMAICIPCVLKSTDFFKDVDIQPPTAAQMREIAEARKVRETTH